jgi:TolB-like protein
MTKTYQFGPYRLVSGVGMLMRDDKPTALGPRAAAVLQRLLEQAGQPISKEALIDAAWPGLVVEQSNLTVQVAALRKVLDEAGGAAWIETLPRRGYRYAGPPVSLAPSVVPLDDPPALGTSDKPSVAVLPFANLSGDREQGYFAEGMVEDIVNGLSRIRWLFVIARSSTLKYQPQSVVDSKQAGRELGVRYVLQGSVRKAQDRIRIACQLVEAASGVQVWSERYDRALNDLFDLQDEVAIAVLGAIEPTLRQAEARRVRRTRPDSLRAYELVLQAQTDVFSGMPEPSTRALGLLDRAMALEPGYALAHAYAAMCHHNRFLRGGLDGRPRGLDRPRPGGDGEWPGRRSRADVRRLLDGHGRARSRGGVGGLRRRTSDQPVERADVHPRQRGVRLVRAGEAGDRMGREGPAAEPFRRLGLRGMARDCPRAVQVQPLRCGGSGRDLGDPGQPGA